MIQNEKSIYIFETETKSNRYSAIVLAVTFFWVLACWLLNEIGIFHVGLTEMRVGTAIPLSFMAVMLLTLLFCKKLHSNRVTKYFIMGVSIIYTAFITVLMTFHTTIMLLFPMFIAMLYRSRKLGVVGLVGSVLCTVLSPILGYMLGTWDVPLLRELIGIATNGTVEVVGAYTAITGASVAKIALYIVFPRLLMVGSCAILMFYVIKLGVDHVENQIALSRVSRRDALTGLYNQSFFKGFMAAEKEDSPAGVIFMDANALKATNDALGHEAGDAYLKRCAKSVAEVCLSESENGFRVGGDEFLILLENATEQDVINKIAQWQAALDRLNREEGDIVPGFKCSMAVGYAVGSMKRLQELVNEADTKMYRNKAEWKANNT